MCSCAGFLSFLTLSLSAAYSGDRLRSIWTRRDSGLRVESLTSSSLPKSESSPPDIHSVFQVSQQAQR
jgi:hypothetical protein